MQHFPSCLIPLTSSFLFFISSLSLSLSLSPSSAAGNPPVYSGYAPPTVAQPYQQATNTTVVLQPARHTQTIFLDVKPPNYVVLSVITMIFFCWIFGLIALLVGLQVRWAWQWG